MAIELEPPYFFVGLLTLIGIIFAIILGLKIVSKYFQYKQRVFLLIGLSAILLTEPWWPSGFGFLVIVLTKQNLSVEAYLILGVSLHPLLALFWVTALTDLMYKDKQKLIIIIVAIYGGLFELLFFIFLFTNMPLIGDLSGYFDPDYGLFVRVYQFSLMALLGGIGFLFAREALRSENPEVKLKGKFFMMAIFTFFIGGIIDIYAQFDFPRPSSIILVIIARIILLLTTFEFYCSLILPQFVKKLILREK